MKKAVDYTLSLLVNKPQAALVLITALFVPALYICLQLEIKSDFKRLLPSHKPSVVSLDRILDKVGGVGVHQIQIESTNPDQTIAFIEALIPKLRELPEKYVRNIDYKINDVTDFFEENKYLYVDVEDLNEIEKRLSTKIDYEKQKQNPFFFDLEDQEVVFDISDIEKKYESEGESYTKYYEGYFFSEDRSMAVVLVYPSGATTGTSFSKDLVTKIDQVVTLLNPTSFDPSMKITYGGKFLKVLEQYQQLIDDIVQTLGICLLLVALIIYVYFLRLRVVLMLSIGLLIGSVWTFALVKLFIGSLNSQTAFLGSIIVGNGVNTGVFFLSRYFEERRKNNKIIPTIQTAFLQTYIPTFIAAFTTSLAFAALGFSEITGMSEFGFIGGIGMLLCWLATMIFLPAFLSITETYFPMHKDTQKIPQGWKSLFVRLSSIIQRNNVPILVLGSLMVIVFSVSALSFLPNALEYDFRQLQNKFEKSDVEKERYDKSKAILDKNLNPSIILLESKKQSENVCETIMDLEKDVPKQEQMIDVCKSLQDFLPKDQEEKLLVLSRIRTLISDDLGSSIRKKYKDKVDDLMKSKDYHVLMMKNLPDTFVRKYKEKDGNLGRIVYVYNKKSVDINDGKKLIQYTDLLSGIPLQDGSKISISGDYPVFADLLRAVKRDGPLVSFLSFLFVIIFITFYFRNMHAILFILGNLVLSMVFLLGTQSLFGIKLNFFNYIAIPVTIGIGVDYAVNLYQRYSLEGRGKVLRALETTGGAIVLCSLTTIIGYSSLTLGINQALVSFGYLALIGEISCIVAGLIVIPTILYRLDKKNNLV